MLKAGGCAAAGSWYSEVGAGPIRDWILYQIPDIAAPSMYTCKQGFVWRLAYSGDTTCAHVAARDQAAQDNAVRQSRWVNGAYGPYTCVSPYVWREARAGDVVCVTPEVRSNTAAENAAATSRLN